MTDNTARLGLPYLLTGQAQKEVTHNEALDRLDAIVQLTVLDRDLTAPPASPAEASVYLVAAGAVGAWLGKDGQVAAYDNGWRFLQPREGWLAWVADEDVLLRHTGGGWTVFVSGFGQTLSAVQDATGARAALGLGPAALLTAGAAAGNLVQLDGTGRLPAVDGSQLLNLPGGGGPLSLDGLTDVDTATTMPGDGQALVWHAAASLWKPASVSGGGTLDADLTAIAGLTGTGLIERTGDGTAAVAAVTAAGKALLDDADAAAQRTTLGLGSAAVLDVGTTAGKVVQLDGSARLPAVDGSQLTNLPAAALDADLTAIAGLSGTGLIERTGDGTAAVTTVTAAGKALLDDADAAAQRTTLGLGSAAVLDVGTTAGKVAAGDHGHAGVYAALAAVQTFSGAQRATVTTLSDGATITPDFALSNDFTVTLAGNRTMSNPTNAAAGQSGLIAVVQDATGNRALSWGGNWDWEGGSAPTLSTAANAVDVVAYWCRSPTSVVAILAVKGAS